MKTNTDQKKDAKLLELAREQGWRNCAFIDGVLCCVQPFAVTWGIVVGIDEFGYQRRYCYEHATDAFAAFAKYTDPRREHPSGPWVKVKGAFMGETLDDLNPALFAPDPLTGLLQRKDRDHGKRQEMA
jgi:hypothetical protein